MLILTRKIGECINIGEQIKVYVLDVKGRQVSLGIEAPRQTVVYRAEVYQKIMEENRLASQIALNDFEQIAGGKGGARP
jgi:carbon storage regulator